MSVAVSAGMGESCPLQQEKDDKELEEWRQEVRAKVTALKCHVMASRGLTPEGNIVAPYSPRILLEAPPNARLLHDADNLDLNAYTESLQNRSKGSSTKDETEYSTEEEEVLPQEPLSLDDVHVRLKEIRVSSSDGQKASASPPSPSKSVHSLNNKSQPSSPSHSPSTCSSSPQSPSTSSPTNLSPSKQSSPNVSDRKSVGGGQTLKLMGVAASNRWRLWRRHLPHRPVTLPPPPEAVREYQEREDVEKTSSASLGAKKSLFQGGKKIR
ncbi:uncharacterized protein LOC134773918 [Penaeus indicus]|uniref:uncharacterized protein LOC134773918 n=1 Tax=Penaeus indicus TaxID=29960 RepID=UPI00300D839A